MAAAELYRSAQKMKITVTIIWLILVLGGLSLCYWFTNGSWRMYGSTLIEHDIVRFGPIPMFLSVCWAFLFLVALLLPCKGWSQKKTTRNEN